jgi:hypothetical protein
VFVVNPGTLSKKKGFGSYTLMSIHSLENSGGKVGSKLYDRARGDIIKI